MYPEYIFHYWNDSAHVYVYAMYMWMCIEFNTQPFRINKTHCVGDNNRKTITIDKKLRWKWQRQKSIRNFTSITDSTFHFCTQHSVHFRNLMERVFFLSLLLPSGCISFIILLYNSVVVFLNDSYGCMCVFFFFFFYSTFIFSNSLNFSTIWRLFISSHQFILCASMLYTKRIFIT